MRSTCHNEEIMSLLSSKEEFSAADFFRIMPGCAAQTIYSRIRSLIKSGVLEIIGKGKYRKVGGIKYQVVLSDKMIKLNDFLTNKFPGERFCLREIDENIIIETRKSILEETAEVLNENDYIALLPFTVRGGVSPHNCVLLRPLTSDSPIKDECGVTVPTIEKELVDSIKYDTSSARRSFQLAFDNHPVNTSRLLRYASRRGLKKEAERFIEGVDKTRALMFSQIRAYLKTIPVEEAWLFGSYSRCEETPESDIDLLVKFKPSAKVSLWDLSGYKIGLEDVVRKEVDLIEYGCLKPFAQTSADAEKYLIYAK